MDFDIGLEENGKMWLRSAIRFQGDRQKKKHQTKIGSKKVHKLIAVER